MATVEEMLFHIRDYLKIELGIRHWKTGNSLLVTYLLLSITAI